MSGSIGTSSKGAEGYPPNPLYGQNPRSSIADYVINQQGGFNENFGAQQNNNVINQPRGYYPVPNYRNPNIATQISSPRPVAPPMATPNYGGVLANMIKRN